MPLNTYFSIHDLKKRKDMLPKTKGASSTHLLSC